jgi:hypothetical protein
MQGGALRRSLRTAIMRTDGKSPERETVPAICLIGRGGFVEERKAR